MRVATEAWLLGIPILVMTMGTYPAALQEEAASDAAVVQGTELVAEVVIGTCDEGAQNESVVALAPFVEPSGERVGSERAAPAVASISLAIPLSLDQLEALPYAIGVRATDAQDEALLACGELSGVLTPNRELIVGLGEQNDSGLTGIALLSPDPADPALITASIFLAENVVAASVDEPRHDVQTRDPAEDARDTQPAAQDPGGQATPAGDQSQNASTAESEEALVASGPLAYWRLDEASGAAAVDATGHGLNGVYGPGVALNASSVVPATNNPAAVFDGSSGAYIDMGDVLDFADQTRFSLEAWVAPARLSPGTYPRIAQKEGIDTDGVRHGYVLYLVGDTGQVGFERWRDDTREAVVSPGPIPTGKPTHVVAAYDGETMRLFINGSEVASSPSTQPLLDSVFPFRIGNASDGTSPFDGRIDDVAVYDFALDAETVGIHFRAGFDLPLSSEGTPQVPPAP